MSEAVEAMEAEVESINKSLEGSTYNKKKITAIVTAVLAAIGAGYTQMQQSAEYNAEQKARMIIMESRLKQNSEDLKELSDSVRDLDSRLKQNNELLTKLVHALSDR